jgi:serine protease Do
LGLENEQGVLITRVKVNSAGEDAGLERGDVILEINRQPVQNVGDYRKHVTDARPGDTLLFLIYRRGGSLFIPVEVPKK